MSTKAILVDQLPVWHGLKVSPAFSLEAWNVNTTYLGARTFQVSFNTKKSKHRKRYQTEYMNFILLPLENPPDK